MVSGFLFPKNNGREAPLWWKKLSKATAKTAWTASDLHGVYSKVYIVCHCSALFGDCESGDLDGVVCLSWVSSRAGGGVL